MIDDTNLHDAEELEDTDLEENEEEVEDEAEEATEEQAEENEEQPAKPKKDKVTAAVIRVKQENKRLRDENASYKKKEAEREQLERDRKTKQKLIDDGYTEQEAEEKIRANSRIEALEREVRISRYERQAEKLSQKYPDLPDHLDKFIGIVEASNGAITLAELCKAKLDESTVAEIRTKTEQELLLTKSKAKDKQVKPGENKGDDLIKFSPADEEAYKYYASKNPGKTRKDYNEILKAKRGE